MPGNNLTVASQVQCLHGGVAVLVTSDTRVLADGGPILLETDVHPVVGCPFTVGPKYSPCVRIEWAAGASSVTVGGVPVLVQTSIGKCIGIEGAPQGLAIVASTQAKVSSQ